MEPRLTLITLGVSDVARARKFYEVLGFKAGRASQEAVTFFPAGGVVLALFGRAALAEDATVTDSRLVKSARKAFWGGYSGYFTDPDGHLWEVAYNPYFRLDEAGRVALD